MGIINRKPRVKSTLRIIDKRGKKVIYEMDIDYYHLTEIGDVIIHNINCKQAKMYLVFSDGSKLRLKSHYVNPFDALIKKLKYRKFE